jgi:cellulose synthase/poly-beta-1,6-N-acetylglucosamine synthase-like glycosyltransferase
MAHFYDWNPFTKQLISDYLSTTHVTHIHVRVDDVEPNTPEWKVTALTDILNYSSVLRLSFGVIPEGTWIGGSPYIMGIGVNDFFHFYWAFFLIFAFFPFTFFLFWRILSRKDKKPNSKGGSQGNGPGGNKKPTVSVIIPAYNEEAHISSCLEAIQKQDFKGNMEVIVVNDGSTDRTAEIASKYPINLIDLKTNQGKANALNIGIANSTGDIIVFSDSDSELASGAVTLLVNSLEDCPDAGAVAGSVYVKDVKRMNGLLNRFQMIEYEIDQGISRYLQGLNGSVLVCPGPLFAVRRELAEKTLFSNRTVIEDSDFTVEILKKNMKVLYEPAAKVYTNAPLSLKAWFKQRKRWMFGNLQLWRIHKPWAQKNPWMIFNYLGFITASVSLILLLLLPYLFFTFDGISVILLRGIIYAAVPILLFTLLITPFFLKNRILLVTVIPYTILYGTMKALTLTYTYLRYIFGLGIKVTFGSREIVAR